MSIYIPDITNLEYRCLQEAKGFNGFLEDSNKDDVDDARRSIHRKGLIENGIVLPLGHAAIIKHLKIGDDEQ